MQLPDTERGRGGTFQVCVEQKPWLRSERRCFMSFSQHVNRLLEYQIILYSITDKAQESRDVSLDHSKSYYSPISMFTCTGILKRHEGNNYLFSTLLFNPLLKLDSHTFTVYLWLERLVGIHLRAVSPADRVAQPSSNSLCGLTQISALTASLWQFAVKELWLSEVWLQKWHFWPVSGPRHACTALRKAPTVIHAQINVSRSAWAKF